MEDEEEEGRKGKRMEGEREQKVASRKGWVWICSDEQSRGKKEKKGDGRTLIYQRPREEEARGQ